MSNIPARAQKLIQRITSDPKGFGTDVIFETQDGSFTATVGCVVSKHMMATSPDGFKSISKTETLSVSEALLQAAHYPTRNDANEVSMLQHKVTWTDVSGLTCSYTVRENRPDDTFGLITLVLDDFGE
jgi:hypothetical protein